MGQMAKKNMAYLAVCFAGAMACVLLASCMGGACSENAGAKSANFVVVPSIASYAVDNTQPLYMGAPRMAYMDQSVYDTIAAMDGVSACTAQLYVEYGAEGGCCVSGETIGIIGYDASTDFLVSALAREGLPLRHGQAYIGSDAGSYGSQATFFGEAFDVVGELAATGTPLDGCIVLPIDQVREAVAKSPSFATVRTSVDDASRLISSILVSCAPDEQKRLAKEVSRINGVAVVEASR